MAGAAMDVQEKVDDFVYEMMAKLFSVSITLLHLLRLQCR
jgi:hypothetical protein